MPSTARQVSEYLETTGESLARHTRELGDAIRILSNMVAVDVLPLRHSSASGAVISSEFDSTTGCKLIVATNTMIDALNSASASIAGMAGTACITESTTGLRSFAASISALIVDLSVFKAAIEALTLGPGPHHRTHSSVTSEALFLGPSTMLSAASPQADVQHWNAAELAVLCPFCTSIHHHAFAGVYSDVVRPAGCGISRGYYCCKFPFTDDNGACRYEMDKHTQTFKISGCTDTLGGGQHCTPPIPFYANGVRACLLLSIEPGSFLGVLESGGKEECFYFEDLSLPQNDVPLPEWAVIGKSIYSLCTCRLTLISPTSSRKCLVRCELNNLAGRTEAIIFEQIVERV